MFLSVLICSHNPRPDFLKRTLEGLRSQTLPTDRWELVLVDNASDPPLSSWSGELSWHPGARVIAEPRIGLTHARLTSFAASRGELIVCVDDDNVLAPDYLEEALRLFKGAPNLGAAGGRVRGDFETPPPAWASPFLSSLAIRDHDLTSARRCTPGECGYWTPVGAGMVVRRSVIDRYAEGLRDDPARAALGRRGGGLGGGEDIDIAFTAYDMGLSTAYESRLNLSHIMPPSRVTARYLARLRYNIALSGCMLSALRGRELPRLRLPVWVSRWVVAVGLLRLPVAAWYVSVAEEWGRLDGIRFANSSRLERARGPRV